MPVSMTLSEAAVARAASGVLACTMDSLFCKRE